MALIGLLAIAVASACSTGQVEHELRYSNPEFDAMKKRVAQDRVKMRFLQREETSILGALASLDQSISEKRSSVKVLSGTLKKLETRVDELAEEIVEQDEALAETRERAGHRVRAMHRLERTRLNDLFARLDDPHRVRRFKDYLKRVLGYDAGLIGAAREATEGARKARESAEVEQRSASETRQLLEEEIKEGEILREERRELLDTVRRERKSSEKLANEIALAAKRLERELGTIRGMAPAPDPEPGGFEAQRGRLPWPVAGRVEVPFGKKVDPASSMVMAQKGIDIRAPFGSPVRAIFSGRVAFASMLDGYGRVVIVEHDGGFFTLFAHLEHVAVEKGTPVDAHQMIGTIGDSGSAKGAYLYLEVRHGRDAIDPLKWLAP